jgi:hypothetical protein
MLFSTCNKSTNDTSRVAVRLKDAPADWERMNIDVQGVRLHTEKHGWVTMPVLPRTINILELRDTSTLLVAAEMPVDKIDQAQLILGTTNTITIHGVTYHITINVEDERLLTVAVNDKVSPDGTLVIILDLDAEQSILMENGQFWLQAHLTCSSHHHEGDDDDENHDGDHDD